MKKQKGETCELIIDAFCGGGGASEGIRRALGYSPDFAINHDESAITMHEANHPDSLHLRESIWTVNPVKVTRGSSVGLLWASPDCRHFSRAKGGKPVSRRVRSLANVVVKWARDVSPRVICVENVEEFQTWGPLGRDGRPLKARGGSYFMRWVNSLKRLGYAVEWRMLRASDYGAPTTRKRLFLVARNDGDLICWPTPTHGDPRTEAVREGRLLPWRTAAECIDFSDLGRSIFGRKKPLADATLRRIARGVVKYVLNDPKPFIVPTPENNALASAFLTEHANASGQRVFDAKEPLRTQCANVKGGHFALVAAMLTKFQQNSIGQHLKEPMDTVMAGAPRFGVVAAHLVQHQGRSTGKRADKPMNTATQVNHHSIVAAHLLKHYGGVTGQKADQPLGTVTQVDHHSLAAVSLTKLYGTATGAKVDAPAPTITGQGQHVGLVAAFLTKYYGTGDGAKCGSPIPTITTKDRVALVTVRIEGQEYILADITLRMLRPRELARAQGFPDSYVLTGTQSNQVAKIGNSVVPDCSEAMVRANYTPDIQTAARNAA